MNGAAYIERLREAVEWERLCRDAVRRPEHGRRAARVAPAAPAVVAVVVVVGGVMPSQRVQ